MIFSDKTEVRLAFNQLIDGIKHPFYFCEVKAEKIKLGGPESKRHSKDNWYHPQWVNLKEISLTNLVPESAKAKLIQIIEKQVRNLTSVELEVLKKILEEIEWG